MKRITFITGHYGSGKSEFSLNLSIKKKVQNLIDLDIVNPYFRSRELEEVLNKNKINLIASSLKNSLGSDLPYIAKEVFTPFYNGETVLIDLGGNDVGARLVRQFTDFLDPSEVDFLLCVNIYREETRSVDDIKKMINMIEASSGLRVTGLINNSNLLRETKLENILEGEKLISKLPYQIKYTGVYDKLDTANVCFKGEVIPLKMYLRKSWM